MKLHILCVGKPREKYFQLAAQEYLGRIRRFLPVEVAEIPNIVNAEADKIIRMESEKLLQRVPPGCFLIAMDIQGKQMDSEQFASLIEGRKMHGRDVAFLIGGSQGLSQEALEAADLRLSMGQMTFPHQLARIMLLEQLYRASMIANGQTYHK